MVHWLQRSNEHSVDVCTILNIILYCMFPGPIMLLKVLIKKKSIIVAIIGRQTTKSRAYNIIIIKILCTIIRNLDVNNMWPALRLWIIIKGSWVTLAITVLLLYLCTTFALIPSVRLGVLCALPASAKANLQNWITVKTNFKVKATTSK